jgi:hypothetical protein
MFKIFRITLLLAILLGVIYDRWRAQHRTDWKMPLVVALYPINADASPVAAEYIRSLKEENFEEIESFFDEEARRYALPLLSPIDVLLAAEVVQTPPKPPQNGLLDTVLWSLHFRWWASKYGIGARRAPHARLFLLYVDPATHPMLEHSTAIREGMIGLAHVFATKKQAKQNAVVIAHELLHTLGATDKYDLQSTYPRHPEGFAEPDADPVLPQRFAELMGGRTPITTHQAEIPESLAHVLIGTQTAREIGWKKR